MSLIKFFGRGGGRHNLKGLAIDLPSYALVVINGQWGGGRSFSV